MSHYQLGILGCGNMAEAIVRGAIKAGFLAASSIVASDPLAARRELLAAQLGIATTEDNDSPAACGRVLLAVKPQKMAEVLEAIAPRVQPNAVVISIAAGVTTAAIDRRLGGRGRIVRVMPNTPMLAGAGASALAAGPRATPADLEWAAGLFGACGMTVQVQEPMIDAVTAVSGSGPAYFFYLVEAMIAAGEAEGLPADVARRLAIQTCVGSGALMIASQESPQTLRARVTSPNGTTQRAIETLDAGGAKELLVRAIRAAAERSRELGK